MKLRIRDNTIRLRLTQTEVATLAAGRVIEQTTRFTSLSSLITRIIPRQGIELPCVTFEGNVICIAVAMNQSRQWATSNDVTMESRQPIDATSELILSIEKDFQCLHSEAERIADAYPNPRGK